MTTDDNTPELVPCPACGADFHVGDPRCAACGLALSGPVAVQLWQVDLEIERLRARRDIMIETLRMVEPPKSAPPKDAPPAAAPAAAPAAVTPPVVVTPSPAARAAVARAAGPPIVSVDPYRSAAPAPAPVAPPASAQQLLLGLGVLLLLIASAVFVAVAWDMLGVYGRMAVLVVAIAASAGLASFCSHRALGSSAEALAVLSVGLTGVGLTAAYNLDLFAAGSLSVHVYVGIAGVVLALLMSALHPSAQPIKTYPLVALASSWGAAVAFFAFDSITAWAVGLTAAWLVLASPALRWARAVVDPIDAMAGRSGSPWAERGAASSAWWAPLWVPGLLSALAGAAVATVVIGSAEASRNELAVSVGVVVLVLAVLGVALRVDRRFQAQPAALVPACMAWWIVLGAEGAALGRNTGVTPMVLTVAVCTVLLVTLLGIRSSATQSWSPHLGCAAVGAGLGAAALVVIDGDLGASAFVLALITAGAAAIAVTEPPWRIGAEFVGIASGIASLSFLLVALEADATPAAFAFAGAGLVLAAAGAARRPFATEEESLFVLGWVVSMCAAIGIALAGAVDLDMAGNGVASSDAATVLSIILAIAASSALLYATQPQRGMAIAAALPLAIFAVWVPMIDREIKGVEAYTLSAALACALVGIAVYVRDRDASSWITCGPAAGFALLPSAVLINATDAPDRLVYVITVSAMVAVAGVALRWQAPTLLGMGALSIVALQELLILARGVPLMWSLFFAGALLVVAGVRFERNVRDLRSVGIWLERMS